MTSVRDIARKVWIANVVQNPFVNNPAETPQQYIQYNGYKMSRVNLIATVVDTFRDGSGQFASVTLDDGSSVIRARVFSENFSLLNQVEKGDVVLVVGRVRQYQEEVYVLPEIVRRVGKEWELARKVELVKQGNEPHVPAPLVASASSDKKPKFKILDMIREKGDEGASMDILFERSVYSAEETRKLIEELINEGEIYEPKPGQFRII